MTVYASYVLFQLYSHVHIYDENYSSESNVRFVPYAKKQPKAQIDGDEEEEETPQMSSRSAIIFLTITSTVSPF